jgi:hypothetical protein
LAVATSTFSKAVQMRGDGVGRQVQTLPDLTAGEASRAVAHQAELCVGEAVPAKTRLLLGPSRSGVDARLARAPTHTGLVRRGAGIPVQVECLGEVAGTVRRFAPTKAWPASSNRRREPSSARCRGTVRSRQAGSRCRLF